MTDNVSNLRCHHSIPDVVKQLVEKDIQRVLKKSFYKFELFLESIYIPIGRAVIKSNHFSAGLSILIICVGKMRSLLTKPCPAL